MPEKYFLEAFLKVKAWMFLQKYDDKKPQEWIKYCIKPAVAFMLNLFLKGFVLKLPMYFRMNLIHLVLVFCNYIWNSLIMLQIANYLLSFLFCKYKSSFYEYNYG